MKLFISSRFNILFISFILFPVMLFADTGNAEYFGIFSLVPAIFMLIIVVLTRRVLLPLIIGAAISSVMVELLNSGIILSLLKGFANLLSGIVFSVTDPWNGGLLFFSLSMGGFYAVLAKSGATAALSEYLERRAKSVASAQVMTFLIGFIVFFDHCASPLMTGSIMRGTTQRFKIARERLAFIIDGTSAPLTGVMLFSTWSMYEIGIVYAAGKSLNMQFDVFSIFIQTLPYKIYGFLMLIFVFITSITLRDFGPMLKLQTRTAETGLTKRDDANTIIMDDIDNIVHDECTRPKLSNMYIPVIVLILSSFFGLIINGYFNLADGTSFSGVSSRVEIVKLLGSADVTIVLFQASIIALGTSMILLKRQRIMDVTNTFHIWLKGVRSVVPLALILLLSWALIGNFKNLGTIDYISGILLQFQGSGFFPVILFLLSFMTVFLTGTAFTSMAVILPVSVIAAMSGGLLNLEILPLFLGSAMSGVIMGEQASLISNSTILSSAGANCDHIDHFRTQLPYTLFVGLVSAICFYIPAGFGVSIWILFPLSVLVVVALTFYYGERPDEYDYY